MKIDVQIVLFSACLSMSTIGTVRAQVAETHAILVRSGSTVRIDADDARPLDQALTAATAEFGWLIDYEDAVYAPEESKDYTDPEWRIAHPREQGFYAPNGHSFVATLPMGRQGPRAQEDFLRMLAEAYNRSANPGDFTLIHSNGRLVLSGSSRSDKEKKVVPFSRVVSINHESENAYLALSQLVESCSSPGLAIVIGIAQRNVFTQATVGVRHASMSCRDGLTDILRSVPNRLVYRLLYQINENTFYLSIIPPPDSAY
jgi:hypothetical protein